MPCITPKNLEKGDKIGIAATARKVSPNELEYAIQYIQQKGYDVVLSSNIYDEYHQLAGCDEARAHGIQALLDRNDIQAILIARGGYGTIRVIDKLNFEKFQSHPKWICGFSDITVLHAHLFHLGFESIHSTMPLLFAQSNIASQSLFDLLEGKNITYPVFPHPLNRKGMAEGELVGGNLSVLYALNGSVSQLDYRSKILFIEDIDEYLYHIDRIMMQMKRAGYLKQLNGLIVGGMTDMKDNNIPFGKTAEEIIYEAVKEYDYPVCFHFPSGHIKDNMAFIHGRKVKLLVEDTKVTLLYIHSV